MYQKTSLMTFILLLALTISCLAGTGTVSGVLMNGGPDDSSYYYVSLGAYSSPTSLQSMVFKAYPTQGGKGIWYANNSWTLDNNADGQHVTITTANVAPGNTLANLVGRTFTFTYQTTSPNVPSLTIFPASTSGGKSWLVVALSSNSPILISAPNATLHTSIAYSTNYKPSTK